MVRHIEHGKGNMPAERKPAARNKPKSGDSLINAVKQVEARFPTAVVEQSYIHALITGDDENAFLPTWSLLQPENAETRFAGLKTMYDRTVRILARPDFPQHARPHHELFRDSLAADIAKGPEQFKDEPEIPSFFNLAYALNGKARILQRLQKENTDVMPEDIRNRVLRVYDILFENPFDNEASFTAAYQEWIQFRNWFAHEFQQRSAFEQARELDRQRWEAMVNS